MYCNNEIINLSLNIFQLEKIESNVNSEFELEHLLLEGHCFETGTGNPPRGLQMTLGTKQEPVVVDTIVMANLGYLQLKSNPGRWFLKLREGRSSEIYDIASHENTESGQDDQDIQVLIDSFKVSKLNVMATGFGSVIASFLNCICSIDSNYNIAYF